MYLKSSVSIAALLATSVIAPVAAQAQVANTTVANDNVLNLLSPFLSLNATSVGQATLASNLSQSIATNNSATAALQALAVSDKNLFGGRSNTIILADGTRMTYGIAGNLAGGLPAQVAVNPSPGATTTTPTTPIQAVGALGSVLGPYYQQGVAPIGAGAATTAILANTATLLNTTYNAFTSSDLGVAKNYFANGAATNPAVTPPGYVPVPAVAAAGQTLPRANGLPNTTDSVLDLAYGVKNTQPGQDVYGSSRPVQVSPNGINQFDSSSILGLTTNPSFPSGHTNYAYTDSILLAMLVPQNYQSFLSRGSEYGNSRIVLGVHYPLDIIASRAFSTYELAQAFTNPTYMNGIATPAFNGTPAAPSLPTLFNNAQAELVPYLQARCGNAIATCLNSAANTANDPYVVSAANLATYTANLTYGLPTLTLAQAPQEAIPAGGSDPGILLAPIYGGDSAAARAITPVFGNGLFPGLALNGQLSSATIDQILQNTETNALAAFYGTSLSYYSRLNLYAAAGYFSNVTGTLSLQQNDFLSIAATVGAGGVLDNNGLIFNRATVNSTGTLTGSGVVGGPVTVNGGGTLAPGSLAAQAALQAGAANVAGTQLLVQAVNFAPTSILAISASTTQTTTLAVNQGQNGVVTPVGQAALNGAAVTVTLPTTGTFVISQNNAIVTTVGGVVGRFASVTSNLLFATPTLSYDVNNVFLSFASPNFRAAATTRNQFAVATALTNGALINPNAALINNLQFLTTAQAAQGAATLASLTGSGLTAAQNVAHRSAEEFTSSIFDQLTFYGANPGNVVTITDEFAARAQGFAPVRELADLPAARAIVAAPVDRPRTFRAWASGFGGVENIGGNAGVGFGSENNSIAGGSAGIDYQFLPGALVGVAAGGTGGTFSVPSRATSGSTNGGHVAGYGLASFGASYFATSLSGSFFNNQTTRTIAGFGALGGETDSGNFSSREVRLRAEAGRRFGGFGGAVIPFVALEIADLRSGGFSEFNRAGPTVLGLTVPGQDSTSVPAFVGARIERSTPLGNGLVLTPTLQVAYVHEFAPQRTQFAGFATLPSAVFLVDGARPSYNAAQVKAGAELALGPHASLFGTFDGEFSGVSQFYGGKGGFKYVY